MDQEIEEALRLLTPDRRDLIREVLEEGLGVYDQYPPELRRDHNSRVEANIRNCHIVGAAQRRSLERADIRVSFERGRVFFVIADRLKLSFKKLNKKLMSSNIPTQQAMAFVHQNQSRLEIDLPPALVNVIAGYTVDRVGTPERMYVTVPKGRENLAEVLLGDVASAPVAPLATTPAAPVIEFPTAPARKPRRVAPRPGVARKLETNGSAQ